MSKNRNSSNDPLPFDLKKGGALVLILALLVLVVNVVMTELGNPLPEDVIGMAEEIVTESLPQDPVQSEEPVPSNSEPQDPDPTPTRRPHGSQSQSLPWADADGDFDYYVLALSWEPAFCETKPDKEECVSQSARRYDATHFVLHGLWPNLEGDEEHTFGYCDVPRAVIRQDQSGDWCEMPGIALSDGVRKDLTEFMPGSASCLQYHEWYKHGVCAGMSADAYFALTNALVQRFSQSDFNRYVARHVGREVKRNELLEQFDGEFGTGARDYLSLRCSKLGSESLLTEIQIALQPDLGAVDDFAELFPDEPVPSQGNCPKEFTIDPVGQGDY